MDTPEQLRSAEARDLIVQLIEACHENEFAWTQISLNEAVLIQDALNDLGNTKG